jgi:hypothetical protein
MVVSGVSRSTSCRRHRSTPPYGSDCWLRLITGSRALLLHVCADTSPGSWSPLGRHGHARACMQPVPPHACLACFCSARVWFSRCMHVTCRACLPVHVLRALMLCSRFVLVHLCMLACGCPRSACTCLSVAMYESCPTRSSHTEHVQHAGHACTHMLVF